MRFKSYVALAAGLLAGCGILSAQEETFTVKVDQPEHGRVIVTPEVPADGVVKAGTVLDVKVEVTDPGWVFDSGYYLSIDNGMFYPVYKESMVPEFKVTVNTNIMSLGASIIEESRLKGYSVIQDVQYAKPGVKPLKYDVFIPDGAKNLPCIVIIHGGGWSSNTEDIMRGLARELIKGGKYVVCSIDYRWLGNLDGDAEPNTMPMLIEDCFGAILHIQEHAAEYGADPTRIAVTGDSAGGHLSACMGTLIERVGDGGFGVKEGVYEFLPTYLPAGMTADQAREKLLAIKAVAPSYGVFDRENLVRFVKDCPVDGQEAIAPDDNIPQASVREIPHFMVLGTLDRTVKREPIEKYTADLKAAGQEAELVIVDGAGHAFFDWKPDQRTKDTFAKYGVPYAAKMLRFFDGIFYNYPFMDTSLPEDERLDNALSLMTVDEKIATVVGQGVPRLGIANPGSTEAIHGIVRGGSNELPNMGFAGQFQQGNNAGRKAPAAPTMVNSTAFPQAYGIGETWDREMAHIVGDVMSIEARYYSMKSGRNCLVLWAPNADLARDPRWGRTEESFGEDPYLVGEMVAAEVRGIQGDDPEYWRGAALMKHFLANSNEDNRYSTDSRFDEELFRDYYSYGFWKGARAGAKSLMTAYNSYNGVPCMANDFIKDILHDEWGMDGMIVDDAGALMFMSAAHDYTKDINESIKLAMEAGLTRFIDSNFAQVKAAYDGGFISDEVLDACTKSNLRTMLKLGLLDAECPYEKMEFGDVAPWETQEFKDKARLVSQKSVVLLKNDDNILPIDTKKVKKIAVFGNRAEKVLKDWYGALPSYTVSPLDGIKAAVEGTDVEVRFQRWDSDGSAQKLAQWADVCIVCVGNHPATSPDWDAMSIQAPWAYGTVAGDGREALDRRSLQLETEDLIKVIWQANHNTVVALISSFPFAINWTQENVPGIVHMTQCSQELGNALADVLFGRYNPAGRTTQTWVKDILDLPNMLDYDIRNGRTYMYFKGEPLYPFGYGLSYTEFEYSKLNVSRDGDDFVFDFSLKNTGDMDGEEVVQLYVRMNGDDATKRLRGFERIPVKAGETKQVKITVPASDLELWNSDTHSFELNAGKAEFMIGASSEDIRLSKTMKI